MYTKCEGKFTLPLRNLVLHASSCYFVPLDKLEGTIQVAPIHQNYFVATLATESDKIDILAHRVLTSYA